MRRVFVLSCALVGLLFTACIPESQEPITPLAEAEQDVKLVGAWRLEDQEYVRFLHIGAEGEKAATPGAGEPEAGLMRFTFVSQNKGESRSNLEKPFSARFFVSEVGEDRYANVLLPIGENNTPAIVVPPHHYMLFKYQLSGDELTLWVTNFRATADEIERGELGGTVMREGKDLRSVTLTDSSENLADYLKRTRGEKLFGENKMVFRRVR